MIVCDSEVMFSLYMGILWGFVLLLFCNLSMLEIHWELYLCFFYIYWHYRGVEKRRLQGYLLSKEPAKEKNAPQEPRFWTSCSITLERPWKRGENPDVEMRGKDTHPKTQKDGWDGPGGSKPATRGQRSFEEFHWQEKHRRGGNARDELIAQRGETSLGECG